MPEKFDPSCLRTVHLVPLTAYRSDGQLNLDAQQEHTARMRTAGMECFLPAAGTSEFHSLSTDEVINIVRATRDGAGDHATVFAPVGLQVGHAVEIAERSRDAGADGIMFMPFSHPYLSDAGARDYYETVIETVNCPVLIYRKGAIPTDQLLLELAAHPRVVGVKYAVNEMHNFRNTVLADQHNIEWVCGSAERFAPYYMLAGSPGYTTGLGNLCPRLTLAMHAAFTAGHYVEGMRLQQLIVPIEDYRARDGDSYNISMLKHGLKLLGHDFGPARPPQRQLTSAEESEIKQMLQPIFDAESRLANEHG